MSVTESSTSPKYSISEAAERTGVAIDTLRYYEKAGLMPDIGRTHAGQREYSLDDCGWILFVRRLRATAMPVSEIARYAALVRDDTGTIGARRAILETHRNRVRDARAELEHALTILDRKIEHYAAAEHGIDVGCSDATVNTVRLI
ncbi:MerR family transcriptional regulator [Ornithinimicrobium sp. Arc0846-15]|nr:MerR family transcriptional regulator [Ornithinimicrobium laminariae]